LKSFFLLDTKISHWISPSRMIRLVLAAVADEDDRLGRRSPHDKDPHNEYETTLVRSENVIWKSFSAVLDSNSLFSPINSLLLQKISLFRWAGNFTPSH